MIRHLSRYSLLAALICCLTPSANGELLSNAGFETGGSDWGSFGSAGFNEFFGPNGHASLFMDNLGNSGGVFQVGINGAAGVEYTFELTDVRIESNAAANVEFGLEFLAADDNTKLGELIVPVPLSQTGDNLSFSMSAISLPGTAFVRPIIKFDNVTSTASGQENIFVFEASLTAVPEPTALTAIAIFGLGAALIRRRS